MGFADGHVESKKWQEPVTWSPQLDFIKRPIRLTRVPGSRDFRWLHDRTTAFGEHGPRPALPGGG